MADTSETHAEITAEMRFHGQQNIDAEKDKPEYGILTVEGRIIQNYADRLEAAWKREKSVIEADALSVGGIVGATAEKSSVAGDAAKLREALMHIQDLAEALDSDDPNVIAILDTCRAALAEPVRNCGVGTVKEQSERYNSFCHGRRSYGEGCGGCPLCGEPCCELAWAQMPYEEGGAK